MSHVLQGRIAGMKLPASWAAAVWAAAVFAARVAQAAPPQPVIQMPQNPATATANPGAGQDLDPNLVHKLAPGRGACLRDGTGYVSARIRGALNMDLSW